ncbi:MAG: type II toxin-antitoxin system HicB family antitoxin [Oscillospiraceae bacterium]|jgi:predicted RNase H-like HicB family nuclease|nr:type II toxin-antitoxin system HicB family antitoxin [Oscillospiraceae bacterium]
MKTKFTYPAIFTKEESGYFVDFPDIKPCYTEGHSLEEATIMAKDVLESCIEYILKQGEPLPTPTDIGSLSGDRVMLIVADIENIKSQTRYVKKTLSIPYWLNAAAEKEHINFSRVLQEALRERLAVSSNSVVAENTTAYSYSDF